MTEVSIQEKAVGLLARNEEQIGQLYRIYADKFPEQNTFWSKIAGEEDEHAAMVRRLFLYTKVDKSILFNENRFESGAVESFIKFVGELIEKAKQIGMSELDACYQALDLEKSLLERKIFEVYDSDEPRFMKTLIYLEVSTEWHISTISQEIERIKQKTE